MQHFQSHIIIGYINEFHGTSQSEIVFVHVSAQVVRFKFTSFIFLFLSATRVCDANNPCQNGATCVSGTGSDCNEYTCQCPPCWTGLRCDQCKISTVLYIIYKLLPKGRKTDRQMYGWICRQMNQQTRRMYRVVGDKMR